MHPNHLSSNPYQYITMLAKALQSILITTFHFQCFSTPIILLPSLFIISSMFQHYNCSLKGFADRLDLGCKRKKRRFTTASKVVKGWSCYLLIWGRLFPHHVCMEKHWLLVNKIIQLFLPEPEQMNNTGENPDHNDSSYFKFESIFLSIPSNNP